MVSLPRIFEGARPRMLDVAAVLLVVAMGARLTLATQQNAPQAHRAEPARAAPQHGNRAAPALGEVTLLALVEHDGRRADPSALRELLQDSVADLDRARRREASKRRLAGRMDRGAAAQQLAVLHVLRQISSRPVSR